MNHLAHSQACLQAGLMQDCLYRLAYLTVWLDPLWIGGKELDDPDPYERAFSEGDDPLEQALLITRECLPELYVEAVDALHLGMPRQALERLLCRRFSELGIPMESLEHVWFGIPLPAYGSQLSDPDFYEQFPLAQALLQSFGADVEVGDIPEDGADIALMLIEALRQCATPLEQQLAWVLAWLWGISGNSGVDLDEEMLSEYEPLSWEAENVAFARELIAEAETIMGEVMAGLNYLHSHPDAVQNLKAVIQSACKLYRKTYPKGGNISHDELHRLAQRLHVDGAAFAGGAV